MQVDGTDPVTNFICMIHALGETYGMLPSQVIAQADTFDMMVFDAVSTIREYKDKKSSKKDFGSMYDKDSLSEGLEKFRSK